MSKEPITATQIIEADAREAARQEELAIKYAAPVLKRVIEILKSIGVECPKE